MTQPTPEAVALERIEAARLSGATSLNLSNLGLRMLPPQIGSLTKLIRLHLNGNQLASLRALRELLDQKDPQHQWGGLRKKLTPEHHYLWLCDYHASEYAR